MMVVIGLLIKVIAIACYAMSAIVFASMVHARDKSETTIMVVMAIIALGCAAAGYTLWVS